MLLEYLAVTLATSIAAPVLLEEAKTRNAVVEIMWEGGIKVTYYIG